LGFSLHSSNDIHKSGHSRSVVSVLDFEEISEHLDQELGLVFIGTNKLRAGVTFNEPKVKLIIEHEIETEHFIDVTSLPESLGGHSEDMNKGLSELGSKIVLQPVGIMDFSSIHQVFVETFESPHLIVSKFFFVHSV